MAEKSSTGLSDGHGQFHDKSRRRKSVASHMAHPIAGETMKERQQRIRENREARRKRIKEEHKFVMNMVSFFLEGIDPSSMEEFIIDSEHSMDLFDSMFATGGRRSLMFFFQECHDESSEIRARAILQTPKTSKAYTLHLTDGSEDGLTGIMVYCTRADNRKEVKVRSISEDISFGVIDISQKGLMQSMKSHLTSVYLPAIQAMERWGELTDTPQGEQTRDEFLDTLDSFVQFTDSAIASADMAVKLQPCEVVDFKEFVTHADFQEVAANQEIVVKLEELIESWCKQIEQVLAESEQMRREADDTGPMAELEHWKMRMARFNSLVEKIKSHEGRSVIKALQLAKSKVLKTWRLLDSRITDAANEAKDNVKFLYTLEKACEPLYRANPVGYRVVAAMIECIAVLINSIQMIHSISRYYNTPQRMTALFIKVTNQMVRACKNFVTDRGLNRVWDQPRQPLIEKLKICLQLNESYQMCFQKTKAKIALDPSQKPFEFSEMSIFGKFDAFCKRVMKIIEVLNALETFSVLSKSKIEGIESMASKFNHIYSTLKKKPYDPLDHRRPDFTVDFAEFKRQISELQGYLQKFMTLSFSKLKSTSNALDLLVRFEKLGIPSLEVAIEHTYRSLLLMFGKEIEIVRKIYAANCNNPPLARDRPQIAGSISWSRQLMRHIRDPMNVFEAHPTCLQTKESRAIIKNFNRMATILVEFEMMYHHAWTKEVEIAKSECLRFLTVTVTPCRLQASLLVHDQETGNLLVNFDPQLTKLMRETECMMKINLEIPDSAKLLFINRHALKRTADDLKMMIEEVTVVKNKIPNIFQPLMAPHIEKVEAAISPGVIMLNWNSMNIKNYIKNVYSRLRQVDLLVKQVNDIRDARIDSVLMEMSEMTLCELPSDDPWTTDQFLAKTQVLFLYFLLKTCSLVGNVLDKLSLRVEDAVHEIVDIFKESLKEIGITELGAKPKPVEKDREKKTDNRDGKDKEAPKEKTVKPTDEKTLEEEIEELIMHFNHKTFEALLKATRNALDGIKRRVFCTSSTRTFSKGTFFGSGGTPGSFIKGPFFIAEITLAIPQVIIHPSLEDIQQTLNKTAQCVLEVSRSVAQWGQKRFEHFEIRSSGDGRHSQHIRKTERATESKEELPSVKLKNHYKSVSEHKDVTKLLMIITSSISSTKAEVMKCLEQFSQYQHIWEGDKEIVVKEFAATDPLLSEFKSEILRYQYLEQDIDNIPVCFRVGHGAIELYSEAFKIALSVEIKAWKLLFGHSINDKYRVCMDDITQFISDFGKKLSRPVNDLEDVRSAMAALEEMRQNEIRIDMTLGPIEEAYSMLNKFEVAVAREEVERVDTLRYSFKKLLAQAREVQSNLVQIQPQFKADLLDSVEVYQKNVGSFNDEYVEIGPMAAGIAPQEASDRLSVFQSRFDELWRKFVTYSGGEQLFGLEVTDYPDIVRIKKELGLLQKLYGLYNSVIDGVSGYYDILWIEVDIEKINGELLDFQNRCRKLPKALKEWDAFLELKKTIDDFSECCPLLELMANKAMKDRHWERIANLTGHTFDVENENFQLRNIMEAPLLKNKEDIEDICISAVKEKDIEAKLSQVVAEWRSQDFSFASFKNRGELLLKGAETSEIVSFLEDSLMMLSSLLSNSFLLYNAPFKKDIQLWVQKLSNTSDIIENWMIVQNLWVYLEAVFVGGDIAKQLPKEAKRFASIDKSWVKIMTRAHESTNVVLCCVGDETMGQLLPHLLEQLELCQKSLTGYLEKKRLVFPRFFFVSDPALLEILGQASDSHTIQAHLLNVFDNVKNVGFHEKDYDRIMAIISSEGETVQLETPVIAKGNVEMWLGELLNMAMSSLHGVIRDAFHHINDGGSFSLMPFMNQYPAQVGLLGIQMIWTRDAEEALQHARHDKKVMSTTNQKFLNMLNSLIDVTTQELTKMERTKYETLVTIHVHQRDIFDDLVKMHIRSVTDFEWLKQSRFYFKEDIDACVVSITDVNFTYQNEFIGCTDRLVITPLTDRCYITLAQALGMSMGGAPAGPAGTGKTETTKDMGKALGKYVVVFNCSDQMDFRGLGRIYKGLAQSGSWGCFDEFNRIELPVLSVAAQQIYIVLTAKKDRKKQFIFSDGDVVELNPEFGIFLTMVHYDFGLRNILSVLRTLGAAKRASPQDSESTSVMRVLRDMNLSKLVDEDEPLFLSLISDLFPGIVLDKAGYPELEGFIQKNAEEAGLIFHPPWVLKIIQLYETQRVRHGMMALGPSGAGKTTCISTLMKAMGDCGQPHREMRMNPKAITAPQMFGKLDVSTNDWTDGIFSTLWRKTLKAKKGENIWIILDGPVDAIWIENLNSVLDDNKTLTLANGDRIPMSPQCKVVFEPHNIDNASPATVSRNGMVFMSSSVMEWQPILKAWLRSREPQEHDIFEQLFESVFDDVVSYVTQNLRTKMTILECNIIKQVEMPYCNHRQPKLLYTVLQLTNLRPTVRTLLPSFYQCSVLRCTNSSPHKNKFLICFLVLQCIDLLEGLIPSKDEHGILSAPHLSKLFIFSLMWGVGALLELEDREKMQEFLFGQGQLDLPVIDEDNKNTIFEFVVDSNGNWEHWNNRVQEYIYPPDSKPEYSSILVPNVDNVRTSVLIDTISKQGKAVLLIGEQGTAKTVMIKGYMSRYNPELHVAKSFNFSSATTPLLFQRTVESLVEKRVGTTYGPPAGRKMTTFIDDINMPVINEWGDQLVFLACCPSLLSFLVTNEIVRQLMEMKGFYNLEKPGEFTHIVDIQFTAAMIHPGGGRNDIPERLKRKFSIFNCTLPSNASIDKIFGVIGTGFFCPSRFNPQVCDTISQLVACTRALWQKTKIKMLPTPAKFHYIFNLRDLSRIWEGMLNVTGTEVDSRKLALALWKNECTRVIADRFTNEADRLWFEKAGQKTLQECLGDEAFADLLEEPYFVDFLREAPEPTGEEPEDADLDAPKIYELVPSFEFLNEKLGMYMQMYNETVRGGHLDLVFFKDAMVHLVKISRIIRTPCGNALLVGVGGSGKQSLTRLASFIAGYKLFQITLSRTYNVSNLMDDLKNLYRVAGCDGQGITFLFTDNEIKDEAFLEYLNNVLSSGEVSNLFARDELDEISQNLIPVMKKELPRVVPTQDNLYAYFISRARKNLHVVLCFSPVGEKFRNRSLKFPGLISGCTMDWFTRWPKDALIAVADYFLSKFDIVCTTETKGHVVQSMGVFHDIVAETCIEYFDRFRRQTHVTPKSYLSFIDGYKTIYKENKSYIGELAERMKTGLDKLVEASASVAELSLELVVKEKELAVASIKADKVLIEVTASAQAAEKVKASVQKVKDKAQAIVDEIDTIKATDISTVRKLAKPPHLIMRIMDCVLLLFRRNIGQVVFDPEKVFLTPNWSEAQKLMGSSGFLQTLMNFPKDSINEEAVELLQPYLQMPDYNMETAKKVCGNVAGLSSWTIAMAFFYGVNKEVLPLKANLIIQEARHKVAMADLNKAQSQLDDKQKELDAVQAMYDAAVSEKQTLLDDAESCKNKMVAASALINGLGGEKVRWTEQSREFQSQIGRLVGDVLLATGFLSYSGPFNQTFRTLLLDRWQKEMMDNKIPFTNNLNLTSMLTDGATVGEWNLQGLPSDELSIQNGIIVTKATRYPLLIDPQTQGKSWLLNREKNNELQVTALNHKYFRNHLEDALSLGRPLLIEDVGEELDPALDNVLEKNFIKSGSTFKVKVGDKECDVMSGFRMYITTKLGNPAYTPEISARTAIIDFTVTMKGLEEQLLGRVINTEKQELEAERVKLIEDVTSNKRKMKELEDNLLYRLTSTQGSLVEDESLVAVLNITKETAEEVSEKLAVAAETETKINLAREEFRPVATRGSILYFLIVEMSMVNIMYQTSLRQFLGVFDLSMARSAKSPIPAKRIQNIIEFLTYEVFKYSCRGLYENHKFLFTLLLALKIDIQGGKVKTMEFQTFIKGGAALDLRACPPKPFKWITDMTWLNLVELSSKLPQFSGILDQVRRNDSGWRSWFDKDAPEEYPIPDGYQTSLDTFRKLLLVRSWCPDRTLPQARKYIADTMGERYAEGVILNLEATWEESTTQTPLICFLSMGSDPTGSIESLAKRKGIECRAVSMGQGQEVHARRLIQQSGASGGWVLLQNCHLGLNFMDELLESVTTTEHSNESLRVWITTEGHPQFPISLLQASIKFTNEPPQGVKPGLKRTYAGITQDQLDITNMMQWKPMLYAVAFLHTVVQERRKFGPLGWNIPYEFNQADFTASVQFIQNHLDDVDPKKGLSWNTIRYMLGEVQYGGRVTDDYDKRLLITFAKVWFGDHMFADSFNFYTGYTIPKCKTLDQFMEAIQALPSSDTPQVFGLHSNADITYQSKTAKEVLDTIMSIQPKDSGGGGGETRESIVMRLARDMLEKLPADYITHEVRGRLQKMGALTSMNIFLRQEIDRMQRVISLVRQTLTDLQLAIEGTIIMSENLRDALDNMFDARIPELWKKISWESSTLGFWFTELIERNTQFSAWLFQGRPSTFWMTGFFNPQGFLTAMRQEVTRAHKGWALDAVVLHNDVIKQMKEDITSPPGEGVYIYGLYLDGASWDRRGCKLTESQPKVLFTLLPVVHVYAVNSTAPKDPRLYQCPVYKKPQRTDLTYITPLWLKTVQIPDHWTMRGVALLCDIK
ncbi:hypothetical protein QZH41_011488 [Actinostola sp. cb2023]|nr:hypothetical protein QZH41_011488 [Actinostola sp. cb2023]